MAEARERTWVGRWLRDESFWRDVVSQLLSGIILAIIVGVAAALAGVIPWTPVRNGVLIVATILVGVILLLAWAVLVGYLIAPLRRRLHSIDPTAGGTKTPPRRAHWAIAALVLVLDVALTTALVGVSLFGVIWGWSVLIPLIAAWS